MTALRVDLVFPRFKLLSGAERAILGLAGALEQLGHGVRVVCHQFDPSCRPRLSSGVDVCCSHARLDWSRNRYLNAVSDYARTLSLGRLLDPQADLYLLFGPSLPLVWTLTRAKPGRAPVLYYCWEPPRVLYQDRQLVLQRVGWPRGLLAPLLTVYASVDRALVRRADGVCTSSSFAAGRVEAIYDRAASVIMLGIDRDRLGPAVEAERPSPPRVLTVNYLHPRKRVHLILEAAAAYKATWAGTANQPTWVIVGDGPERAGLEALSRQLGLEENVEFAGFVPDDDLPKYYAAATCYVHAGLDESFGLSVIEAAYCGCPVVAVNEGGVQKTVENGVTGHLVLPTARHLAQAVHAVLERPDAGRAMGIAGHERISQTYRWRQGATDILDLARTVKPAATTS